MKKKAAPAKRTLLLYGIILFVFTVLILSLFFYRRDEKLFTSLTHDLFVEEMIANTLNMHYNLAVPENFGIHEYTAVLPAYHPDNPALSHKAITNTLNKLSQIDPANLTREDAYTHQLLTKNLQCAAELNQYSLYQRPLAPSSGMQSQLPILLAEYTFRTVRDVEDYLKLLEQTDTYFTSLLEFEQQKQTAGLSMSTYSLRQTKEQCDTIVTKEALETGTHFLQTTFEDRLKELAAQGLITPSQMQEYVAENDRLLLTVVQPAYESLADGLFLLEDTPGLAAMPYGLCSLPEGNRYYEQLLISETGSYRSIKDVKNMLQNRLQQEYAAITSLASQNPNLGDLIAGQNYTDLPLDDAYSMLADLQKRMEQDFPTLPYNTTDKNAPNNENSRLSVKPVSASLQEYCAPAFYLTAPLDDTDTNVIYINEKNPISDLELYTTLAHEGYPGHLYQTVYNNRDFTNQDINKARQLLWYGGYLEGWAVYVEMYGYDYAAELLREQGREEDALCVELEKHNRSLLLCIYSLLDIKIHYENATPKEVASYLETFGIHSTSAANAVYCYIADEPCNYLKYYLGYLEILDLKNDATAHWGNAYTDYDFHCFFLDAGPSDFTSLKTLLANTPATRTD